MHRWYGKIAVVQRWERQTHLKIISKPRGKSMSMSGLVKPTCWVSCRSSASFPQPVAIIYLDVPKRSKQTYTNTLLVVFHPCLGRSPTNRFRGLKHVETIFLGQDQSRLAQSLSKKTHLRRVLIDLQKTKRKQIKLSISHQWIDSISSHCSWLLAWVCIHLVLRYGI